MKPSYAPLLAPASSDSGRSPHLVEAEIILRGPTRVPAAVKSYEEYPLDPRTSCRFPLSPFSFALLDFFPFF